MPTYRVDLVFQEPATFGESPDVGNAVGTLDFVPATALRGALAAALSRRLPSARAAGRLQACFGNPFPRWAPAFPVLTDRRRLCVPMPATWLEKKRDIAQGFINTAQTTVEQRAADDRDWKRTSSRWLAILPDGTPTAEVSVPTSSHMHLALHYARQSHRAAQLFSRASIETADVVQEFRGFVADPDDVMVPDDKATQLYLGKRRSAGNGRARVTWTTISGSLWPCHAATGNSALIQLMTPAILPGPCGGMLAGITSTALAGTDRLEIKIEALAWHAHEWAGWSGSWGLPREPTLVVAAGAVFRLRSDDPGFSAWLKAREEDGIGIRRNEGFGWIAVNPVWLDTAEFPRRARNDFGTTPPDNWPGIPVTQKDSDELRRRLRELRARAQQLQSAEPKHQGLSEQRVRAIAAFSQRVQNVGDVLAFLRQMALRTNTREWNTTLDLLAPVLENNCRSIDEAHFFLEAITIYAPQK